jgi:hypothetical protein
LLTLRIAARECAKRLAQPRQPRRGLLSPPARHQLPPGLRE